MKKKDIAWLFSVIVLVVLLGVSIFMGISGFFSSITYMHSNSDIKIGETSVISVSPNSASVASLTFDGSFLPHEKIPQVVQISAENLDEDVYVRVKAQVFGSTTGMDFVAAEHFEQAEDGYFYFDDVLKGGNKITFCTYLLVPEKSDFVGDEKYILSIVVETLSTSNDLSFWTDNV